MRKVLLLSSLAVVSIVACTTHPTSDLPVDGDGGVAPIGYGPDGQPIYPDSGINTTDGGSFDDVVDAGDPDVYVPQCGDANMPKCELGEKCRTHEDCGSGACDDRHLCIADKSCVKIFGGRSCGVGEVGSLESHHESCCATAALPNGIKLDKYKITAGRMRAMVEATDGNIRGWYTSHRNELAPVVQAQLDPFVNYLPASNTLGEQYSVPEQLGSYIYVPDKPSKLQGCFVSGTGTHTYWLSQEENAFYGDIAQGFSREVLDTKPIQCVTMPMVMALCAFDGKKLQTYDESITAYGTGRFAWGNTPEPGGWGSIGGAWSVIGAADEGFGVKAGACPTCDTTLTNWSYTYEYPERNPAVPSDYSYWLSAPGRFPADKGPYGHLDETGDVIEWTATDAQYTDDKGRTPTFKLNFSGSFEGHDAHHKGYAFTPMMKYGKIGARCSSVQ